MGKLKDLPGHTQCLNSTLTWVDFPSWCFNQLRLILFFPSPLPPALNTLTAILPVTQSGGFASCDYRNNIVRSSLCYPTPTQSWEDLFIELHDCFFLLERSCCPQRETTSDLHQSITTALCYIHVSCCFPYTGFSLLFSVC